MFRAFLAAGLTFHVVLLGGLQCWTAAMSAPAERYDWIREQYRDMCRWLPEAFDGSMDWAWGWTWGTGASS